MVYMIDEIELDCKPRERVVSKLPVHSGDIEMSEFDSGFLCGLIQKFRPRKFLELGVASGGTTAIILQCLADLQLDCEIHSVDISPKLYSDSTKETGYLGIQMKTILPPMYHKFYIGHGIPYFLSEIGAEIDFLLLDTSHFMPGEVLDFIEILPYLTDSAVVCIHDIAISQAPRFHMAHACSVLFQSVTAKKIMNFLPNRGYPNIAAFQITSETRKNIMDVFCALTMRWNYVPAANEMERYKNLIQEKYPAHCLDVYDEAVRRAIYWNERDVLSLFPAGSKIALYGAGHRGRYVFKILLDSGTLAVVKWVDRNYADLRSCHGMEICSPDSLKGTTFDYVLVTVMRTGVVLEIYENLNALGIPFEKIRFLEVF